MAIVLGLVLLITVAAYYATTPFRTVDEQDELLEEKEADQAGINKWMAIFGALALVIAAGGIGLGLVADKREESESSETEEEPAPQAPAPYNLIVEGKNDLQILPFDTLQGMRDHVSTLKVYPSERCQHNQARFYYTKVNDSIEDEYDDDWWELREEYMEDCTEAMIKLLYLKKKATDFLLKKVKPSEGSFVDITYSNNQRNACLEINTSFNRREIFECPPKATWGQLWKAKSGMPSEYLVINDLQPGQSIFKVTQKWAPVLREKMDISQVKEDDIKSRLVTDEDIKEATAAYNFLLENHNKPIVKP